MTAHALLLSGLGRYADPWHPFAETSAALAELLRQGGFDVVMVQDVDAALADLAAGDKRDLPALLAVNVGLPRDGGQSPGTPAAAAGLRRVVDAGIPLLVSHSSSTSFVDLPEWEAALGGRWVRGTSMHPEYGYAAISVRRGSGAVIEGIPDFALPDERYSYLRTAADITVHATHQHEGIDHPVVWSLERGAAEPGSESAVSAAVSTAGNGRTFYDALGHDAASYKSSEHREILRRAIAWLADSGRESVRDSVRESRR